MPISGFNPKLSAPTAFLPYLNFHVFVFIRELNIELLWPHLKKKNIWFNVVELLYFYEILHLKNKQYRNIWKKRKKENTFIILEVEGQTDHGKRVLAKEAMPRFHFHFKARSLENV